MHRIIIFIFSISYFLMLFFFISLLFIGFICLIDDYGSMCVVFFVWLVGWNGGLLLLRLFCEIFWPFFMGVWWGFTGLFRGEGGFILGISTAIVATIMKIRDCYAPYFDPLHFIYPALLNSKYCLNAIILPHFLYVILLICLHFHCCLIHYLWLAHPFIYHWISFDYSLANHLEIYYFTPLIADFNPNCPHT